MVIFRIFIFQENHQYWFINFFKKRYINSTSHEHNPKSISQLYRQYPNSFQLHMFKENRVLLCLLTLPPPSSRFAAAVTTVLSPRGSWHRGARTDLGTQRGHRKGRPWCSHWQWDTAGCHGNFWNAPWQNTEIKIGNQKHKIYVNEHVNIYIANPKVFWGEFMIPKCMNK